MFNFGLFTKFFKKSQKPTNEMEEWVNLRREGYSEEQIRFINEGFKEIRNNK